MKTDEDGRARLLWRAICCLLMFVGCVLTGGCEKVELPSASVSQGTSEPSDGDSSEKEIAPITGTGQGTATRPYTVADLLEGGDTLMNCQIWVIGYVVGWTERVLSKAEFTAEGAKDNNVLLADAPDEDNPYFCIPVRLTSEKRKNAIGLKQNPDSLRHAIRVLGVVGTYMKAVSLVEVDDYQWLGAGWGSSVEPGNDGPQPPAPGPGDEPQPGDDDTPADEQRRDTVPVSDEGGPVNGGRAPGRFRKIPTRRAWL